MNVGDKVRVTKGKQKGKEFTIEKMATSQWNNDVQLYLVQGSLVIFRTTKDVELVEENLR